MRLLFDLLAMALAKPGMELLKVGRLAIQGRERLFRPRGSSSQHGPHIGHLIRTSPRRQRRSFNRPSR
ncbi:hypothetical protein [Nonomuraea aurantiaca]|uniref:hypothetical protein n=1 Tax=Nonomuraea aurantiaca TaxID=2878562 RepID=UPI001CD91E06|nr:hypothetical protein [Nonomuraea aurantiaca]MCA2230151.1 hypothetical protein [Nonomuraea aurantiaca]